MVIAVSLSSVSEAASVVQMSSLHSGSKKSTYDSAQQNLESKTKKKHKSQEKFEVRQYGKETKQKQVFHAHGSWSVSSSLK